jgi:hypothetical protein
MGDRVYLEKSLSLAYEIFDKDMRSYKGEESMCSGENDLCETHHHPLISKPKWEGKTVTLITKCRLGPQDPVNYESDDGSAW